MLDGSGKGVSVPQRVGVGTGNNAVSGDASNADSGGSGDGWGSGVTDSGDGGDTGVNVDGWGHGVVVGVLDNGLGPGHLDDVLSTDWDWDGHVVWLLDVDGASLKGSGYSDVDLGDHWLEGLVVVSGDVGLGAVVDLLGHLLGWLVDGVTVLGFAI